MANPLFTKISETIALQLEAGVRPWSKPWVDGARAKGATALPVNDNGRAYRGGNVFWLWMVAQSNGYASNEWITFNQAKAQGGCVRKGEKGTQVFFWQFPAEREDGTRPPPWCKVYTVFNLDQCEGLRVAQPVVSEENKGRPEVTPIESAEAVLTASGAKIAHGGSSAFYQPALDRIQLPERSDFKSIEGYYGTAFHELGHWTGHETRLKRTFGRAFGDEKYAAEELVAELTAAFVCASMGIPSFEREDHAAYIGSWIKMLRHDPMAFTSAAGKAQAAADFILKAAGVEAVEDMAEAA